MSLKETKSDEFYCESVAKSISEIIRFSLDEDFRKSSFKLFGVSSTKETEKEISSRLMAILKNKSAPRKNRISRKRRKKSTEETDKENVEEQNSSDAKDANQPHSDSSICKNDHVDSQMLPQKFFQKNWLQISSQQYRDVVKRRKLNYFSQPQFSKAYDRDLQFSNADLHFSNSQPNSSISDPFKLFHETIASSHQYLENSGNFCQKLFEVSFKDNASKYLKKNSKLHKKFNF